MNIEKKVRETIKKYKLINKKDKILVAASGGKDSMLVLYLLKKLGYAIEALHINLYLGKYSDDCLNVTQEFCKENKIPLHVLDIKKEFGMRMCNIRQAIQEKMKMSNCMACGIIKKWLLNKEARKLKASKIATGHNLDDEAQTAVINFLQGNLMLGINSGVIQGKIDKKFVPRIKPLFFIPENEIRKYVKRKKIKIVSQKCPCALESLRIKTRAFLNTKNAGEKLNIVGNYLEIIQKLRKKENKGEPLTCCEKCGEPSRNPLCRRCEILGLVKK